MTFSSTLRLVAGVACVALAAPAAFAQPVAPEPAALEAELAALFVPGGLTSDQAATRARSSSPTVERKAAELDAASASVSAAKLGRIPRLTTKLSYTRLSSIDSPELAPGVTLPIQLDSYVAQAQLVVPLSDYVLRHPAQIDAAGLAQQAARIGVRASELDAAETARLAYYEWVRARLQVVVSGRQLAQVQATQRQVRALADAQRVPRADLLRVESLQAEAEQGHEQLQQVAALREEMLREQIGARADETLAIGEDVRDRARDARAAGARRAGRPRVAPAARLPRDRDRDRGEGEAAPGRSREPLSRAVRVRGGRLGEPEPARVPPGGPVHVHLVGRDPAVLDPERRADLAHHEPPAPAPSATRCTPTARTSSARPGSRCSPRSRASRSPAARSRPRASGSPPPRKAIACARRCSTPSARPRSSSSMPRPSSPARGSRRSTRWSICGSRRPSSTTPPATTPSDSPIPPTREERSHALQPFPALCLADRPRVARRVQPQARRADREGAASPVTVPLVIASEAPTPDVLALTGTIVANQRSEVTANTAGQA